MLLEKFAEHNLIITPHQIMQDKASFFKIKSLLQESCVKTYHSNDGSRAHVRYEIREKLFAL